MRYTTIVLSTIILGITSFFVLKYYFFHYWFYMFNMNTKWNKYIEKPRLAIYSITIPLTLIFYYEIYTQSYEYSFLNYLSIFSVIFLYLFMIVITLITLRDSLVTKLTPRIQRKNLTKTNVPDSIIKEDEKLIETSFNEFNNQYFEGNFNTYRALANYTPLKSKQNKLVWISKMGKRYNKKGTSNIRILIEFISILFETEENKLIENIINEYFIDINNQYFIINNSISKWKKDQPSYLETIRSDIKTILKF